LRSPCASWGQAPARPATEDEPQCGHAAYSRRRYSPHSHEMSANSVLAGVYVPSAIARVRARVSGICHWEAVARAGQKSALAMRQPSAGAKKSSCAGRAAMGVAPRRGWRGCSNYRERREQQGGIGGEHGHLERHGELLSGEVSLGLLLLQHCLPRAS